MPRANPQVRNQQVNSYQARIERSLTDIFFDVPAYERELRTHPDGVSWTLVSAGHTNGWAVCELCGHRPIRRLFWIAPVVGGSVDESRMMMIGSECAREYARVDLVNSYLNRLTREQNVRRERTRRDERQAEMDRVRQERMLNWRNDNPDIIEWLADPAHLVDRRNPGRQDSFLTSVARQVMSGGYLSPGQTRSVAENMVAYDIWFAERASEAMAIEPEPERPVGPDPDLQRLLDEEVARNDTTVIRGMDGVQFYHPERGDRIRFLHNENQADRLHSIITNEIQQGIQRDLDAEVLFGGGTITNTADEDEEVAEAQAVADNTPATADDARHIYNGEYLLMLNDEDVEIPYLIYTVRTGPLSGQRIIKARIGGAWRGFAFLTRSGHMRLWRRFQDRNDEFVEYLTPFDVCVQLFTDGPSTWNSAVSTELNMRIRRRNIRCRICNGELGGNEPEGIHLMTCVGDRWTPRVAAPQAALSRQDAAEAAQDPDRNRTAAQARAIRRTETRPESRRRPYRGTAALPPVEHLPVLALDELGHGEVL